MGVCAWMLLLIKASFIRLVFSFFIVLQITCAWFN